MGKLIAPEAEALSARTHDAYSYDNYLPLEWTKACQMLLNRGFDETEVEAIMRSKWTRWAHDMSGQDYGETSALDLMAFIDDARNNCTKAAVRKLVEG